MSNDFPAKTETGETIRVRTAGRDESNRPVWKDEDGNLYRESRMVSGALEFFSEPKKATQDSEQE